MQFCKNCGKELDADDKFCPACGTPVKKNDTEKSLNKVNKVNEDKNNRTRLRNGNQVYGVLNLEELPAGHIIDDRYEVKNKIGQGGFGAVYLVYDQQMKIEKALKVIPEAISNDKEAMFDLQREAQILISINHPNIIRVYDFHSKGAIQFIDMEYIDGKTLSEIKLQYPNKQIPEEKVIEYAKKIADGMAYAHENKVLHKDLKPQNIKLNSKGNIKIMDFGIAETVRTSLSRIQNTTSSGSLVYMSPEQLMGENVGKESDIYSFGAMLYDLLNGKPPLHSGDVKYQILKKSPSVIPHVSDKLNRFLLKCLKKDYKERFRNFEEVSGYLNNKRRIYEHEETISSNDNINSQAFHKRQNTGNQYQRGEYETRDQDDDSKRRKVYHGKASMYKDVVSRLQNLFNNEDLDCQVLQEDKVIIVQARKKPSFFRSVLGMDMAATVKIERSKSDLIVSIGSGKWLDKVGSGILAMIVFWPALLTTGWGLYMQKTLFDKIEETIDELLYSY